MSLQMIQHWVSIYLGCVPTSADAGSHNRYTLNFGESSLLFSIMMVLLDYKPFLLLMSSPTLIIVGILCNSFIMRLKYYLIAVLICISPVISNAKHVSM